MKHLHLLTLLALFISVASCTDDALENALSQEEIKAQSYIEASQAKLDQAEKQIEDYELEWINSRSTVTVPAGSVDALADAIAEVGVGGTVVLASGDHTENQTLVINHRVRIQGENGANLLFPNAYPPMEVPREIIPAIHIQGSMRVWLRNFSVSTGTEEASRYGIVIEDAPQTRIEHLNISGFQDGILIDGGDESQILRNTVVGVLDEYPDLVHWGIANSSGQEVVVFRNNISNYAVGIFFSDANGLAYSNTIVGGTIGVIWCTVPAWQVYPDGKVVSAASPANAWTAFRNTVTGAVFNYLIVDGATNSVAVQNRSDDAVLYDYEIAGESERFGFTTPPSSNSLVVTIGAYSDASVKDCTGDNTIIGGSLVDTSIDPCF